jgi:hypothetical protein
MKGRSRSRGRLSGSAGRDLRRQRALVPQRFLKRNYTLRPTANSSPQNSTHAKAMGESNVAGYGRVWRDPVSEREL